MDIDKNTYSACYPASRFPEHVTPTKTNCLSELLSDINPLGSVQAFTNSSSSCGIQLLMTIGKELPFSVTLKRLKKVNLVNFLIGI